MMILIHSKSIINCGKCSTDIYVNTITGDIVLKNQNSLEEYLFEWIEETDLQLTAQIILPSNFDIKQLYTIGVQIKIPYTPIYKPIKIRFGRDFGGGNIRIVTSFSVVG